MQTINLTVRQLNIYVRSLLEGDTNLASITLEGEIFGFKRHYSSGHWYFTLKDNDASVKSVMFKGNTAYVDFVPEDGMKVICNGYVSLFERDGQFQFYAESMRAFGEGCIAANFERIKRKLESEGLFDSSNKRNLPQYPQKIGVITAENGAAFQDILQVMDRRYPLCEIVLFPSMVQGSSAPVELINALEKAYSRSDLDLIIIGRGGGSAEDLFCFNDEKLARTISRSHVPIISAVGHEIDFTICDFVADLRAPTPSAAAELAVPSSDELLKHISFLMDKITNVINRYVSEKQLWLDNILARVTFSHPKTLFESFELKLNLLVNKIEDSYASIINNCSNEFNKANVTLEALSPNRVMERGYSVLYKNDKIVIDASNIETNDNLNVRFYKGTAEVKVLKILLE